MNHTVYVPVYIPAELLNSQSVEIGLPLSLAWNTNTILGATKNAIKEIASSVIILQV